MKLDSLWIEENKANITNNKSKYKLNKNYRIQKIDKIMIWQLNMILITIYI